MDKIIGNIVGIPNPQSDLNQTNPSKADYVHNQTDVFERLKYYGDPDIIPTDDSFFNFTTNDTTMSAEAEILYNKKISELVIPYKYVKNGKTYIVTKISSPNYYTTDQNRDSLTRVILPNTITDIDEKCFLFCVNLIDVNIPESVIHIGVESFWECQKLTKLFIHKSVKSIHESALFPDTTIICAEGSYADAYAEEYGLNIEYTDEVTKQFVLNNSKDLPDLPEYDDTELRLRDERLKYYGDPDIVPTDDSFFEFTTDDETMTASISMNIYELSAQGVSEIVVPYKYEINNNTYSITSIESRAEYDEIERSFVTKVVLPNTITTIANYAFRAFNKLTEIDIPDSVTRISSGAFLFCDSLTSIIIPRNVTEIGVDAFYSSSSKLTSVTILSKSDIDFVEGSPFSPTNVNLTVYCYKNTIFESMCIKYKVRYETIDGNIVTETTESIVLKNQQELRLGTLTGNYSLHLPFVSEYIPAVGIETTTIIPDAYESYWTFTAGEGLSLTYTEKPMIWRGDDCNSDGMFEPVVGKTYEIFIKKINGTLLEPVIVARVYSDFGLKEYVDDIVGDIETALDSIIDIQNSLMGVSE